MSSAKSIVIGAAATLGLAALLWVAWRAQRTLERDLPTPVACVDEGDAWTQAVAYAVESGCAVIGTTGTPSMEPLIVGRAVLAWRKVDFATIEPGAFILYHPVRGTLIPERGQWVPAPPDAIFAHVAALRDAGGIIPSGLGNARSESWGRVTADNFIGRVEQVYTWPQIRNP